MEEFKNKDGGALIEFDDKEGFVKTYINTFNVIDSQNDISLPGSFAKTFRENFKNIFWYLNHDDDEMLGIPLKLYEDSVGAIAEAQFNLKKQIAIDTYEDYKLYAKHKRSLQHSVRVMPVKYEILPNPEDPQNQYNKIRRVSEWKMKEFSTLTKQGSNPITNVLELKSEQEIKSEINFLKDALNSKFSDERLKNIEAQLSNLFEALKNGAGKPTPEKEPLIVKCKKCGEEFDYTDKPEAGMGYVTCPKCCENVSQTDLKSKTIDYNFLLKNLTRK